MGPGGLNRQGACSARLEGKMVDDKAGGLSKLVCWGFGMKGHHKWSSSCPAKEKECPECKRKGHFKASCKPKKDGKISEVGESEEAAKNDEVDGGLGLLSPGLDSGHFFSVGFSPPIKHSSWDSTVGTWNDQDGDLCIPG